MDRSPESYLEDILTGNEKSVLDVGAGLSGPFHFWFWEGKSLELKGMVDIHSLRRDTPKTWFRVKADARYLPFKDNISDVISSIEMLEHVTPDGWLQVLNELLRVSSDIVYITTTDYTEHLGEEQRAIETVNPFQKYQDFATEELFTSNGFHILFASQHHIIAFKRKIAGWNSRREERRNLQRRSYRLEAIMMHCQFAKTSLGTNSLNFSTKSSLKTHLLLTSFFFQYPSHGRTLTCPAMAVACHLTGGTSPFLKTKCSPSSLMVEPML
ncbi:hypothetical protein COV21_00710 [Candidatus Woesearchaeota archaeon CG10_big_fil_rev_8_21_14_0_10_45_5]|nr:MAG: hypothetical protein COV21_00710 [Candidatus Woesearchaeota archaeon CG10_big_fil_rev_8_21_14_0_10_45_5]